MPLFEVLLPITHTFHWELKPFFYLFRKFWNKREVVTILSDVDPRIPKTRYIPIRDDIDFDWAGKFSNNLYQYLNNDYLADYVIILMADYWLTDYVSIKDLRTSTRFMMSNQHVIRLQISNGMNSGDSQLVQTRDNIEIRERPMFFRGSLIPGLWSRRLLLKYLRGNLDMWGFEQVLSKDIESSPEIKSYLIMPEIIKYAHVAKTSTGVVDFRDFPLELREKIRGFIPINGFTIYE